MGFDFQVRNKYADNAEIVLARDVRRVHIARAEGMNPTAKTKRKMNAINEQSAGQKFYSVCSKLAGSPDFIGIWAFNKSEAKKAFKARNPKVAMKNIHSSKADY